MWTEEELDNVAAALEVTLEYSCRSSRYPQIGFRGSAKNLIHQALIRVQENALGLDQCSCGPTSYDREGTVIFLLCRRCQEALLENLEPYGK